MQLGFACPSLESSARSLTGCAGLKLPGRLGSVDWVGEARPRGRAEPSQSTIPNREGSGPASQAARSRPHPTSNLTANCFGFPGHEVTDRSVRKAIFWSFRAMGAPIETHEIAVRLAGLAGWAGWLGWLGWLAGLAGLAGFDMCLALDCLNNTRCTRLNTTLASPHPWIKVLRAA